tara:strand:- start:168 stop:710 length:543 start_codon:yes stop_codon:yes gene_type:complete
MKIVAALSVAFVVLVGVVAVTYPNESDEVRQRNAAFMKLGDGDTPGGLKADPEQGDAGFKPNILGLKQGDLLGVSAEDLGAVCEDLNEISRIVEELGANDPNLRDLRVAVERAKNNLAAGVWTDGNATSFQDAGAGAALVLKVGEDGVTFREDSAGRATLKDVQVTDYGFTETEWVFCTG